MIFQVPQWRPSHFSSEKKQPLPAVTDYDVCIICQNTSEISSLGSLGYPNLLQVLELRNDVVSRRLFRDARDMDYFLNKNPKVHRLCRLYYTNKDSIVVQQKKAKIDPLPLNENKQMKESLITRSKQISKVKLKTQCFFLCHKERSGKSPTTELWLMYLDVVVVLKKYIHAERTAN